MKTRIFGFGTKFLLGATITLGLSAQPVSAESTVTSVRQTPSVEFLGSGEISGQEKDLSGLTGDLEEGSPVDLLGGFSALDYSGEGNVYWVLPDRGPADGAASYPCRIHRFEITLNPEQKELKLNLLETIMLVNSDGESYLGSLTALPAERYNRGRALDAEGIRVLPDGDLLISDEYGPGVDVFGVDGKWKRSFEFPRWTSLIRDEDLTHAKFGAAPNRGFEGAALLDGGKRAMVILQGPLIQDGYIEKDKCLGNFARMIEFSVYGDEPMKQFLYPLADIKNGVSEILTLDQDRYLVLDRDSKDGYEAKFKGIYLVDTSNATDVSKMTSIDGGNLPKGVQPAKSTLFIDLLNEEYGYAGEKAIAKIEGLCWGPKLSDGRRLLIVCSDNDFKKKTPSVFFAFAISE